MASDLESCIEEGNGRMEGSRCRYPRGQGLGRCEVDHVGEREENINDEMY